jgi:hypothetical protein
VTVVVAVAGVIFTGHDHAHDDVDGHDHVCDRC